jgi:hypothetical protein
VRPRAAAASNASCAELAFLGFRLRPNSHLERIGSHGLGDILQALIAEVAHGQIEPSFHLSVRIFGKTDCAGICDAFQSRRDVDAVAHQVAVAFLHHVADMDADAKDDAPILRDAGVAFDHGVLHLDCATHSVDDAAKLHDGPITRALDDPPVVHRDRRIDDVATERAKSRERSILVRSCKPAEADNIRG